MEFGKGGTFGKACRRSTEACDPFGPARCSPGTTLPYPTFGCYLLAGGDSPDLRTCACAGSIPIGAPCQYQYDCAPGAECVLFRTLACRRVCKITLPYGTPVELGGCPADTPICTPFPGAFTFGFCH
jgi:hypothetical protein